MGAVEGVVIPVGGRDFAIPGYMVWAALLYAASGSLVSWRFGRPLVRLGADRYAREAEFRSALVQGSERAEGIALSNGEADARRGLEASLATLIAVLRQIAFARARLTWVTAAYGWGALVFPIIVAAPGYFAGRLTFGELMMVVGAFNQVQASLRWFVDNTGAIADWRAALLRVMTFAGRCSTSTRFTRAPASSSAGRTPTASARRGEVECHNGPIALAPPRLELGPGERVLDPRQARAQGARPLPRGRRACGAPAPADRGAARPRGRLPDAAAVPAGGHAPGRPDLREATTTRRSGPRSSAPSSPPSPATSTASRAGTATSVSASRRSSATRGCSSPGRNG